MNNSYAPQRGTVAALTIAHLQTLPPGTEVCNRDICAALDRQIDGIATLLSPAAGAGLLKKRMVMEAGAPRSLLWSLGPASAGYQPPEDTRKAALKEPARGAIQTPAMLAPSIFAYAAQRDAAPFSVAFATDGRLTIQRNGTTVLELTDTERKVLLDAAANGVTP